MENRHKEVELSLILTIMAAVDLLGLTPRSIPTGSWI
jgi:hypothetical protein